MLKETYLANIKNLKKAEPNSVFYIVTRTSKSYLSPSFELLNKYKKKEITWEDYVFLFEKEMDNLTCKEEMKKIKELSKTKDVYLVCYEKNGNCHRHILKELIEKT